MTTSTDDAALVARVARLSGLALTYRGRADEGVSGGAIYVDLPDGRDGVVTTYLGPLADAQRTARVLTAARAAGAPVPEHVAGVDDDPSVYVVQVRLPGQPPREVTPAVIDEVVAINDRFAGVLAGNREAPTLPLSLLHSGDPHPRHEVLARHGDRARRILLEIKNLGRHQPEAVTGDDLVHIDLDLSNVLFEGAHATSVVDWNLGAFRGDRLQALVKTRFELEWGLRTDDPPAGLVAAAEHLDAVLTERVPPDRLRAYWAHRLLYQLHWTLQGAPDEVVAWQLSVAEERLLGS